jgi:hypothetical protein
MTLYRFSDYVVHSLRANSHRVEAMNAAFHRCMVLANNDYALCCALRRHAATYRFYGRPNLSKVPFRGYLLPVSLFTIEVQA